SAGHHRAALATTAKARAQKDAARSRRLCARGGRTGLQAASVATSVGGDVDAGGRARLSGFGKRDRRGATAGWNVENAASAARPRRNRASHQGKPARIGGARVHCQRGSFCVAAAAWHLSLALTT